MAGIGRNYALPAVPLLVQRVRILQAMLEAPAGHDIFAMSSMAYMAYPDHTFNSPQGAALAVCKTVAAMHNEHLLFMHAAGGYSIMPMGRAWLAHHEKAAGELSEMTS